MPTILVNEGTSLQPLVFDELSSIRQLLKEYYLYIFMETSIENGVQKGDIVEVVRGRKVKKGTVGVVVSIFERQTFDNRRAISFYTMSNNSRMLRELGVVTERFAGVETSDGSIVAVKEDDLLWAKVREVVDKTFDDEFFSTWVEQIRIAETTDVVKPTKAISYIVGEYKLPDQAKEDLLDYFSLDKVAGSNVWGLANAVTRYAKSQGNYEAQIDLERLGGKLITDEKLFAIASR